MNDNISYQTFESVELRIGTITRAEEFPAARKPAYKIWADFGPDIGIRQTSAQVTVHYTPESLIGRKIMGCLNLGTKNIGGFISEFLLTGFTDENGDIILAMPERPVPDGSKLF